MSPIIDIQRRLTEAGRIRPGAQVRTGTTRKDGKPATRPVKLDAWRFTSRTRRALEAVAGLYGGEVRPWEDAPTGDQFELYTASAEIDVVLPPERISFSQWMEAWSAGGCQHRCDGAFDEITNGDCSCDPDKPLCTPHTRLSVMLQGIPTTGLFRVETQGHYAKAELAGAMELADLLTRTTGRSVLPAKLRLEHRKVIRDGKTRQFVVPVLDFSIDMAALATGAAAPAALASPDVVAELTASAPAPGLTPIPADPTPPPAFVDQLRAVDQPLPARRRANSPPPIPPTGLAPRTAAAAEATQQPDGAGFATSNEEAEAPAPAPASQARKAASPRRRRARPEAAAADDLLANEPAPPDEGGPTLSPQMCRDLVVAATRLFAERQERLTFASNALGREITTFRELTPPEANRLMRLAHEIEQED
ncbi:MAG: hypothetical protein ACRDYZ_11865 [Acidimicrobiales bacterium]